MTSASEGPPASDGPPASKGPHASHGSARPAPDGDRDRSPVAIAGHGRVRRCAATAVVGAALLVGSWALLDGRDQVPGWEVDVFRAVNDLPDALEWPLFPIMQLGTVWMISVAGAIAWLLTRRAGATLAAVLAVFSAWLLSHVVKAQVGRGRPADLLTDVDLRDTGAEGNGYASGHATVAFATATVLTALLPGRWKALPLALAGLVAFARVYFGVHLPLDVVGGAGLGLICGGVAALAVGFDRPSATMTTADSAGGSGRPSDQNREENG